MVKEKSCGCVIFYNDKVLLVFEKNRKFWGFPKGHMEDNETEIETATRECKEEVGLDVIIDPSKKYSTDYVINNRIEKNVVFYLATVENSHVFMQKSEIEKYKWCSFDEALELLVYDNLIDVFNFALKDYLGK